MAAQPAKNWIALEGRRNRDNARLYAQLITLSYGVSFKMFIGHHLAYKAHDDDQTTINEIPSADTLLFDHAIMRDAFGERAIDVMVQLAKLPAEHREPCLELMLVDHMAGSLPKELCKYVVEA